MLETYDPHTRFLESRGVRVSGNLPQKEGAQGERRASPTLPRQAHRRTRVPRKSRTPQRQLAGPPPQQMRCPHPQPSGFTGERRHKRQPPDGTRGIDGPPSPAPRPSSRQATY